MMSIIYTVNKRVIRSHYAGCFDAKYNYLNCHKPKYIDV